MAQAVLVWPRAGGVNQLPLLSGDVDGYPYAATTDGATIVGLSGDNPTSRPVRWDGLTLVTELTGIAGLNLSMGLDRDVVLPIGAAFDGTIDKYSQWLSGGTSGGNLSLPAGYTGAEPPTYTTALGAYLRPCSDGGGTVFGVATGGSGGVPERNATAWISGVPTTLPSTNNPTSDRTFAGGCSPGGVLFVGSEDAGGFDRNATYWTVAVGIGTSHPLILDATSHITGAEGRWCDGNDNVLTARVYGKASDASTTGPAYWTDLNVSNPDPVLPGSPTRWGTIHLMAAPMGYTRDDCTMNYVSETNGVAVGSCAGIGIRWDDTVPTLLPLPATFVGAVATCCSGDGVYVGGFATDADGHTWPVYWDNTNAVHILPTLDSLPGGGVVGVSRDGSTFFGVGSVPVVASTKLNMDNVRVTSLLTESPCTTAQFSADFEAVGPSLGLRWSDTRGKTFGNAVPQEFSADPLWQPQWNRTGMARDRVFELFYSAAFKTAINGAFVEVSPLAS